MTHNDLMVIMNNAITATHDLYLARFATQDQEKHWDKAMHRLLIITEQCRQVLKNENKE